MPKNFTFEDLRTCIVYGAYLAGILLLYINRYALLYEDGNLSLGRTWGWIGFCLAVMFWCRYISGLVPAGTSFPPALEEFLYVILIYEFGKKSTKLATTITDMWSARKFRTGKPKKDTENSIDTSTENWEDETPPRVKGD
jgi:hypothetical protein